MIVSTDASGKGASLVAAVVKAKNDLLAKNGQNL